MYKQPEMFKGWKELYNPKDKPVSLLDSLINQTNKKENSKR